MECVFFFMVTVFVVAGIIIAVTSTAQARTSSLNEAYQQLARRYGGRCTLGNWFSRPSTRFVRNGVQVLVDIYSTGGKNPTYYTQVHMSWADATFRCEVFPEGIWARMGRFLGMEDIQIGSPSFDPRYIIRGSDPAAIRTFLSQTVQWQIERLRKFLNNDDIYVLVGRGTLFVKKRSMIRDAGRLIQLVEMCLALHEQAAMTQTVGIEFTDDATAQPITEALCQICGEEIDQDMVFCRRCKTPHHQDCWQYYGCCSTYGCQERKYITPRTARGA